MTEIEDARTKSAGSLQQPGGVGDPHQASRTRQAGVAFALVLTCALLAAAPARSAVVWAVGDGSNSSLNDDAVAAMIAADVPDAFLYLGDVYSTGTAAEFADYYEPDYGQLKGVTYPTPGNHEWPNRTTGYFPYWDFRFHGAEYYSFDVGGWQILSLNSENGVSDGSAQIQWLKGELAAHPGTCNIAYTHRPRFSAGTHGDQSDLEPVWRELNGHAAIVLAGHDHLYERLELGSGVTYMVVGTGGKDHYAINPAYPGLAAYDAANYGALRVELSAGRASFEFRRLAGGTSDSGVRECVSGAEIAPVGGPPGNDAPKLAIKLRAPRRQSLRYVKRHGLALRLGCDRACNAVVTLWLGSRKKAVSRSRRLGRFRISIPNGVTRSIRLRLNRAMKGRLAGLRGARLEIEVVATSNDGQSSTRSTTLNLH